MIISSEITGKTYNTVEECLAAEKDFKKKEQERKEAEKKFKDELDKAYNEAITACNKYLNLISHKANFNNDLEEGNIEDFYNKIYKIFL